MHRDIAVTLGSEIDLRFSLAQRACTTDVVALAGHGDLLANLPELRRAAV